MKAKFYSCDICGNIIGMIRDKGGHLVCCGKDMDLIEPNSTEANEKTHIPVVKNVDGDMAIAIGSDPHPMVPEHYIEWIAVETPDSLTFYPLQPNTEPLKKIIPASEGTVYAYCNIHGLWSQKL